jgi:hypothetical protein
MFSVPSKFALWIMKEIGNKIKQKQENNKAPVFLLLLRKREGIKAFKKEYVLKGSGKKTITNYKLRILGI